MNLFIQTAFINIKKGNLATPTADQATVNTPEANSSTVSDNIISKEPEDVKNYVALGEDGGFDVAAPPEPKTHRTVLRFPPHPPSSTVPLPLKGKAL